MYIRIQTAYVNLDITIRNLGYITAERSSSRSPIDIRPNTLVHVDQTARPDRTTENGVLRIYQSYRTRGLPDVGSRLVSVREIRYPPDSVPAVLRAPYYSRGTDRTD